MRVARIGVDLLHSVAGAATMMCSRLGPERHRRTGIMPFFEQHNDAAAALAELGEDLIRTLVAGSRSHEALAHALQKALGAPWPRSVI